MNLNKKQFSISSNLEIPSKIEDILINYIKELDDFFYIKKKHFNVILIKDYGEFKRYIKRTTPNWLAAFCKLNGNTIYIYHPNVIETFTTHKKEHFYRILKHELVHLYFMEKWKLKNTTLKKINWINEGLAVYLSQIESLNNESILIKNNIFIYDMLGTSKIKTVPIIYYKQSCSLINFIINYYGIYGKARLFQFIDELETNPRSFNKQFKITFGINYLELGPAWLTNLKARHNQL